MKPYYQDSAVTIYHGDCRDVLPALEPVDLVLTDPPYGIGYRSSWKTAISGRARKTDPLFGEDVIETSWLSLLPLSSDRLMFMFTRWDVIHAWRAAAESAGFTVCQRLIWDKAHFKMGDLSYYGSQVEDVLLFRKGRRPIFPGGHGRRGNIFRSSSSYLPEGQSNHPTQKSEAVCRRFAEDGSRVGETILDPFMGSGTTLRAAKDLNRRAIGIELEEKYCEIAAKRMRQEVLAFG